MANFPSSTSFKDTKVSNQSLGEVQKIIGMQEKREKFSALLKSASKFQNESAFLGKVAIK